MACVVVGIACFVAGSVWGKPKKEAKKLADKGAKIIGRQ